MATWPGYLAAKRKHLPQPSRRRGRWPDGHRRNRRFLWARHRAIFWCAKAAGASCPRPAPRASAGGVYVADGVLHDETGGDDPALDLRPIATLPGRHNWQNAACAWAAARAAGAAPDAIARAMASYPGLAHRQERIAEVNGVAFVNDSKATNGESAARALDCYDNIYWIVGGQAKSDGLAPTLDHLARVRRAYVIGEAADALRRRARRARAGAPVGHAGARRPRRL